MSTINARQDAQVARVAAKATDMKSFLDRINAEPDLEKAKLIAIEMAGGFTAGGVEKFKDSVSKITTRDKLLFLAYNASLKGEGMSTKRF